jgi:anti-sigma regulatory factor (Ser/Thr protein kinase)
MPSQTSDQSQPLAEVSITLPATAEHLAQVYATLARFWTALQASHPSPPDSTWRAYFDSAVGEIVANIVRYAYAASSAGEMSIALRGFRDRVEAMLQDRGVPYTGTPPGEAQVTVTRWMCSTCPKAAGDWLSPSPPSTSCGIHEKPTSTSGAS